eukprot:g58906.t1
MPGSSSKFHEDKCGTGVDPVVKRRAQATGEAHSMIGVKFPRCTVATPRGCLAHRIRPGQTIRCKADVLIAFEQSMWSV